MIIAMARAQVPPYIHPNAFIYNTGPRDSYAEPDAYHSQRQSTRNRSTVAPFIIIMLYPPHREKENRQFLMLLPLSSSVRWKARMKTSP